MQKFVPALFIILMTGLIGAKVALADQAEIDRAENKVVTLSLD